MSERTKTAMNLLGDSVIVNCCIVKPVVFYLITEKDMGDDYDPWSILPPVNFIQYHKDYENDPDGPWGWKEFSENNFKYPKAAHTKLGEMLVVDQSGEVWYDGLGENKQFEKQGIPPELAYHIGEVKNIHGQIYAVGVHRSVVRRVGVDQWESISSELHRQSKLQYEQISKNGGELFSGFNCIDGFEAFKDLYAAGGNSDVWHFDGNDWSPVDIPLAKMQIRKICCAKDGYVYITGRFGVLLKGREDDWEVIKHQYDHEDLNDVVSYKGKVYVASAARLYEIVGNETQMVDFKSKEVPVNHGFLYVNHDLLMCAGRSSAAIYDGKQWKILYGGSILDEATDAYLSAKALLRAEELLDAIGDQLDEIPKKK